MPYVEGVNLEIFEGHGVRDFREWELFIKDRHTMLAAWPCLTLKEKKVILKWMNSVPASHFGYDGEQVFTMEMLPMMLVRDVWGLLWRADAELRIIKPVKGHDPAKIRTKLYDAVRAQRELETLSKG